MNQWIGFCFCNLSSTAFHFHLPLAIFFIWCSWGSLFTVLAVHNEIPWDNVHSQWHSSTPQNHCPLLQVIKRFKGALCCAYWHLFPPAGQSIDQFQLCRQDNECGSHLFCIAAKPKWIKKYLQIDIIVATYQHIKILKARLHWNWLQWKKNPSDCICEVAWLSLFSSHFHRFLS